ncbi:MAG: SDR family oxidoreductase [Chloroflexota bacterium]
MNTQPKTVLITGASRGLGLALARALADEGWSLIINARNSETLQQIYAELSLKTRVTAVAGDILEPAHREALSIAAKASRGLDAIINNAGKLGPSPQPELLDYPLNSLLDVYEMNVVAQLGILQAVQHSIKPQAKIINVTSDAAVEAYPGWGGYGSSKAAFEHLSAVLQAENPDWTVYWVDPGDMRTEMHQAAFPGEDISDRPLPEASVPGFLALLNDQFENGRYEARKVRTPVEIG